VHLDVLRRCLVNAGQPEVDQRQAVARREDPGDALARCNALLDERSGERARLLGAAARECELVGRDEFRRREQVDDELDGVARAEALARERHGGTHGLCARGPKRRSVGLSVAHERLGEVADVTIYPSNELSAPETESLRTVTIRRHPV